MIKFQSQNQNKSFEKRTQNLTNQFIIFTIVMSEETDKLKLNLTELTPGSLYKITASSVANETTGPPSEEVRLVLDSKSASYNKANKFVRAF